MKKSHSKFYFLLMCLLLISAIALNLSVGAETDGTVNDTDSPATDMSDMTDMNGITDMTGGMDSTNLPDASSGMTSNTESLTTNNPETTGMTSDNGGRNVVVPIIIAVLVAAAIVLVIFLIAAGKDKNAGGTNHGKH